MIAGHAVFPTSHHTYLGRCGVTLGLGAGSLTIEMWVQLPAVIPSGGYSLFSYETAEDDPSDPSWDLLLFLSPDSKLKLLQSTNVNTQSPWHAFEDLFEDGAWHHVAVTRTDAGIYTFYKDGDFVGEDSDEDSNTCPTIPDGGCVVLGQQQFRTTKCGSFSSSAEFVGKVTEVRVWNTPRSLTEIQDNKDVRIEDTLQGHKIPDGLVAAWPLDCRHYYDDILGNADLWGCAPADEYSLAKFDGVDAETCPCDGYEHECYDGTDNCHAHAVCDNTDRSFECTCDAPHWEGNGVSCTPTPPFKQGGCRAGRLSRNPRFRPGLH